MDGIHRLTPLRLKVLRLLIGGFLACAVGTTLSGCSEETLSHGPRFDGPSLVDRIDGEEELQPLLDSMDQPLLLVEFYADWCKPCRKVAPVLESIAREAPPHLKIVKVNIDENRAIADRFRVRGIPTVVLIRNHRSVGSLMGVHSKRKYLELIRKAS